MLEVVAVFDQVGCEPVEEVLAPGLHVHIVERLDNAPAEDYRPEAIDDGSRESSVFRQDQDARELLQPIFPGGLGVDLSQLGIEKACRGCLAGGFVAAVQLQRAIGKDGSEGVGVPELPVVDEAVMAGGALQLGAKEYLRYVLGRLDLGTLALVDHASPFDAPDKSIASRDGADELMHEAVVGAVFVEASVEPLGDLPPAAIDEPRSLVGVSEQVIPEGEPVPCVAPLVLQEAVDGSISACGGVLARVA